MLVDDKSSTLSLSFLKAVSNPELDAVTTDDSLHETRPNLSAPLALNSVCHSDFQALAGSRKDDLRSARVGMGIRDFGLGSWINKRRFTCASVICRPVGRFSDVAVSAARCGSLSPCVLDPPRGFPTEILRLADQ